LDGGLEGAGDQNTAEAGLVGEELKVRLCLILVLMSNAILDLVEFGTDPGVIFITPSVESCKCPQTFIWLSVVDEPLSLRK
jgi:hypothetical protein